MSWVQDFSPVKRREFQITNYGFIFGFQVGDSSDNVPVAPPKSGSNSSGHSHHSSSHSSSSHHGKRKGTSVHENLSSAELFNLYTMLNDVKVDLLWGRKSEEQPEEKQQQTQLSSTSVGSTQTLSQSMDQLSINNNNNTSVAAAAAATNLPSDTSKSSGASQKGHVRRPSTASVASSNSTNTLSDTESEISNENDSGIESEHTRDVDKSSELARQYRQHLLGLYRCLEQMTEAANYLTNRYQSDIGSV